MCNSKVLKGKKRAYLTGYYIKEVDVMDEIKLYENKEIRSVWDRKEEWYFSVVDVSWVLSESKNPTDYLSRRWENVMNS